MTSQVFADKEWAKSLKDELGKLSTQNIKKPKAAALRLKEGERRDVTVLFMDVQGFTSMSEGLDPEDVQTIIDQTFQIMSSEIERFHGYIEKYEGDRLMAVFGGRKASEQDCQRSVAAALRMREKFLDIATLLAEKNLQVGMRIGINTGLVVTGHIGKGREQDFTVMGDAVNVASRLEENAPSNEILVSDEVYRRAKHAFVFEPQDPIEVKGKSGKLTVYIARDDRKSKLHSWERSPFTKRSEYVPRAGVDDRISQMYMRCLDLSQNGVVCVNGPAGVGKTRMVYEAVKRWYGEAPEGKYAKGCGSNQHTMPYAIFTDLVNSLAADGQTWTALEKVEEGEELFEILKLLKGKEPSDLSYDEMEPELLRTKLSLGLRHLIEFLGREAKQRNEVFALWFEDLQWADEASLEVFSYLFETQDRYSNVLFFLAYRPEFGIPSSWHGEGDWEFLDLLPLGEGAAQSIIKAVLGSQVLDTDFADKIVKKSGGNPFFLEEIIQSLIDQGVLVPNEDGWTINQHSSDIELPQSLNAIMVSRIDQLSISEKNLLMAASVLGQSFSQDILKALVAKVKNLEHQDFGDLSQLLIDQGYLYKKRIQASDDEEIAFRHALLRDVVYGMLLNQNKRVLHELAAEVTESSDFFAPYERNAILFEHHIAAANASKAYEVLSRVLISALETQAFSQIFHLITRFKTAFPQFVSENVDAHLKVLDPFIQATDFLGHRREQSEALEQFSGLLTKCTSGQNFFEIRLLHLQAQNLLSLGKFGELEEKCRQGLALLELPELSNLLTEKLQFYRLLGSALYSRGDFGPAEKTFTQGLKLAEAANKTSMMATFRNLLGLSLASRGMATEAVEAYQGALALMQELGDRKGVGNVLGNLALIRWGQGEFSEALDKGMASFRIFEQIEYKKGQAAILGNIGVIYHKLGKYKRCLECYEKASYIRDSIGDKAGIGFDLVNQGLAYLHLGQFQKAIMQFERGQKVAEEVGSKYLLCENLNSLGIIYRKLGELQVQDLGKAQSYAESALETAREHDIVSAEVKALSNLGRIHWLKGELELALKYSDESMTFLKKAGASMEGSEEDAFINRYEILRSLGKTPEAKTCLQKVVSIIECSAEKIADPELKRSYLEDVRQNRYALKELKRLG